MNDVLLELGQNPQARKVIKALGLPIPLPQALRRDRGPWQARPLADRKVVVAATNDAELVKPIAECLAAAGADAFLAESEKLRAAFGPPGETFGRPAKGLEALSAPADAVVFDATGIKDAVGLKALHTVLGPLVGKLARSARIVVIGRPIDGLDPMQAAAQAGLEGFVRSVAKEIGRVGATANLIRVTKGAETRLNAVLRFVLSARSAFVSGQPLVVTSDAKAIEEPAFVRPLEKKIAIVTGAARGIGEATARALAQEGAHVVVLDRPAEDAAASQLARAIGGTPLLADMSSPDVGAKIAEGLKALGGVDIIVHNAGITRDKTLARMKDDQWSSVLGINLDAVIRTTTALEPLLHDQGRIVCLSSIAGLAGNMGQTAYAASKAGIVGFVKTKAEKLAGRGITVNAIAPGFIETRMTAAIPIAIREVARRLSALGQGGQPEDVAQAITFLASPGAQGITGRTIRVCGGSFVGA